MIFHNIIGMLTAIGAVYYSSVQGIILAFLWVMWGNIIYEIRRIH